MSDMWYKSIDGVITDVCIWGKGFIPEIVVGGLITNNTNEKSVKGVLYTHAQYNLLTPDKKIVYRSITVEDFVKIAVPVKADVFLDKKVVDGYKVIYLKEFMRRLNLSKEEAAKELCVTFGYFKLILSGVRPIGKRILSRIAKIIHLSFPQYIQLLEHEGFFELLDSVKDNNILNNAIHSLEIVNTIALRKEKLNGTA